MCFNAREPLIRSWDSRRTSGLIEFIDKEKWEWELCGLEDPDQHSSDEVRTHVLPDLGGRRKGLETPLPLSRRFS